MMIKIGIVQFQPCLIYPFLSLTTCINRRNVCIDFPSKMTIFTCLIRLSYSLHHTSHFIRVHQFSTFLLFSLEILQKNKYLQDDRIPKNV